MAYTPSPRCLDLSEGSRRYRTWTGAFFMDRLVSEKENEMNFTAKTSLSTAVLALTMVSNQANAYDKMNLLFQPLAATADAQDLMLHADDNGSTFLYVEQEQG